MAPLVLRAPAKLNLFLHITGRLPSGYHTLESLVVFTDCCDTLTLAPAETLTLTVDGPFAHEAGEHADNLVLRAAKALQAAGTVRHGATMRLSKKIPVGGGLGGGSADAAAALVGLNRLWRLGLPQEALHTLAVTLGADVAMCLAPRPAIVRGIGEQITPLAHPLPPMAAVLVHPRVPLLTQDVYRALQLPAPRAAWTWAGGDDFWQALAATGNDLQSAALSLSPWVKDALQALETLHPAPKLVRMTGSGACCFALYPSLTEAQRAAETLTSRQPGWWVEATEILAE